MPSLGKRDSLSDPNAWQNDELGTGITKCGKVDKDEVSSDEGLVGVMIQPCREQ